MKQENCYLCHKKLNFWFTASKRVNGMKVCTNCHFKNAKKDWDQSIGEVKNELKAGMAEHQKLKANEKGKESKALNFADKLDNLGKKLIIGLTIPIFLLFLGLFTFPIGILFWVLGIAMFAKAFLRK